MGLMRYSTSYSPIITHIQALYFILNKYTCEYIKYFIIPGNPYREREQSGCRLGNNVIQFHYISDHAPVSLEH
jgi:hypothetical protein